MRIVAPSGVIILLVEDDDVTRKIYARVLTDAGYTVIQARDGTEALRLLYTAPKVHAMILDLMMPRVNGWEVMHIKSSDPRIALIPVIAVTGLEARAARLKPLDGVSIILEKPFGADALLQTLARLLDS